ncbi:MAG: hypothetical protein SH848_16315 [Saprospiraceae bacterium]|nr:hypothetical protein [Saprospiraceae bacterium]MDZ4705490.1 hypothetical protein [Saprospiraceae bacterium]
MLILIGSGTNIAFPGISATSGRHGSPVSLTIRAGDLYRTGHVFYCTPNGVWLTDAVPAEFIEFKE